MHLQEQVDKLYSQKREAGLVGLVGGLEAVIINVETHLHLAAFEDFVELLRSTDLQ